MEENRRSKFLSKKELFLLILILISSLFIWIFIKLNQDENVIAALSVNGEIVEIFDFQNQQNQIINLQERHNLPASLEIKDGAVRFCNVDCPDHICEAYGFIQQEGQSAVCMPNRCAVTIYSKKDWVQIYK